MIFMVLLAGVDIISIVPFSQIFFFDTMNRL